MDVVDSENENAGRHKSQWDEILFEHLFEGLLALFTLALVVYTRKLYAATDALVASGKRQDLHFRRTERAYLDLAHTAPGVVFVNGQPTVELEIKNVGHTPCTVVNSVVGFAPLPRPKHGAFPTPSYAQLPHSRPIEGYLVPGGHIFVKPKFPKGVPWPMEAINKGDLVLVACGYIAYEDVFGRTHHAGWGRYYEPGNETSPAGNLSYIPSREYNYDRPAKDDEQ